MIPAGPTKTSNTHQKPHFSGAYTKKCIRNLLAWLLHHGNRYTKSENFYKVKDLILKDQPIVGYDIQHIEGKRCHSCGGKGYHTYYSNTPPYNAYDHSDCWNCCGGWYKMPQWICLARIQYGKYTFHRPLKRERMVKNPFTKEEMGYEVTNSPVIEGYVDHSYSDYAPFARFVLYLIYDRASIKEPFKSFGAGYYHNWWSLKRFFNNICYIYNNGFSRVLDDFKRRLPAYSIRWPHKQYSHSDNDDLPF